MAPRKAAIALVSSLLLTLGAGVAAGQTAAPDRPLTSAFDTTVAHTFLDPAETSGLAKPFVFL